MLSVFLRVPCLLAQVPVIGQFPRQLMKLKKHGVTSNYLRKRLSILALTLVPGDMLRTIHRTYLSECFMGISEIFFPIQ